MAFFIPFALGAAATVAGLHILKNKDRIFNECDCECSCGCGDNCECDADCDCGCRSSVKKKVTEKANFALNKIKSGLQTLESNINENTLDKIKSGLQSAGTKIAELQTKLNDEKSA